jgi:hydroxylamine reductase
MFCYHCQEAKKNKVCDTAGICGKKADVSSLQDLLMFCLKGLAYYCEQARPFQIVNIQTDRFLAKGLYAMVTNVNFSADDFVPLIDEAIKRRNSIRQRLQDNIAQENTPSSTDALPEEATWDYTDADQAAFIAKGETVGVEQHKDRLDPDLHALQECLLYACKGLAALAVHQQAIGIENPSLYEFLHRSLALTLHDDNDFDAILSEVLYSGSLGLDMMSQLQKANILKFGEPIPTKVHLDVLDQPGILISGHDLQDLEDLLEQTAGTGIDIYTHGEALIAHSYPAFKKYFNLVGNYGNAWQDQKTEFPKFNGPILVTTDSIQQPKKTYETKLFSTGLVGWPGVPYIADRKPGQRKDFSALIETAQQAEPPSPTGDGQCVTGFGPQALEELSDSIVDALQQKKISRLIVIAGTDGRHKERKYYTELAEALPPDTLILSAGDTKYRYYQHDFGNIDGIPRLLDVGQNLDFCTITHFLDTLREKMGLEHINQLPVSYNIAWYEQRTLLMILGLLALDIKNLRVGPTLPPFFTPGIQQILQEKFGLQGIDTVENDVAAMLAGQ